MASTETAQEMATLEIWKGPDAELAIGGLRLVACRREVDTIDGGISLYVWSDPSGLAGAAGEPVELARLDLFRNRPHYHAPAEEQAETRIDPGDVDVVAWGVDAIATRAADFAREAGQDGIADALDAEALGAGREAMRALFAGLGEPVDRSTFEVPRSVLDGLQQG